VRRLAQAGDPVLNVTVDVSQIEGAARAFRDYPDRLKKHLGVAMTDSLHEVTKELKDRVPVKTGALRRSWNEELPVKSNPDDASGIGFVGTLGTNLVYARIVEYGFQGIEIVSAHTRSECFGRPTRPFTVPAHTRTVNRPAHPYARPALEVAAPRIQQFHREAITDAMNEVANG
jgi:hypothetical protein